MRSAHLPLLAFASACAGQRGPSTADASGPAWHSDVRPILERHCVGCHNDASAAAGISLASYESAQPWVPVVGLAVDERRMPPWLADGACNSYENDISLSEDDRQTILDWVDAGGPEGDPAQAAPEEAPIVAPSLDRVDLTLEMPSSYTPPSGVVDDYRCFLMPWPEEGASWVTGFDVLPGNADVVHHVIAFIIDPSDAESFRALDAADPAEGYTCYGGPGGDIDTLLRTRWLGGWAPGTGAVSMPPGTGIEMEPGALVALQMHYNTATSGPGPDQSSVAFEVERSPQGWSSLQPWADPMWVLGVGMEIPPLSTGTEHTYTNVADEPYRIHAAGLHMHTLGRSARIEVQHTDGSTTCVLDIPRYDFAWQRGYSLTTPVSVAPGDTLRLSCLWDNPTSEIVSWGEGTGDEMCVGLTLLSE